MTGYGKADKKQMQEMVRNFNLKQILPDDAADAPGGSADACDCRTLASNDILDKILSSRSIPKAITTTGIALRFRPTGKVFVSVKLADACQRLVF